MSNARKRALTQQELQHFADNLSDVSDEYEEPVDDSDADPWYSQSSEYSSDSENDQRPKKQKIQDQPHMVQKVQNEPHTLCCLGFFCIISSFIKFC